MSHTAAFFTSVATGKPVVPSGKGTSDTPYKLAHNKKPSNAPAEPTLDAAGGKGGNTADQTTTTD